MRLITSLIPAALLLACSPVAQVVSEPDQQAEVVSDTVILHEAVDQAEPPELVSEVDGPEEIDVQVGCRPGDGCFGDSCQAPADCLSGFCVDHMGNMVCTHTCAEECPAGFSCVEVTSWGPDLLFLCVSDFRVLCRPCVTNADCLSSSGQEDLCLDYAEEGKFCGAACGDATECPVGYSCKDVSDSSEMPLFQCVSDSDACECSEKSIEMGHFTICEETNELGSCTGQRVCTVDGLTACDALVPVPEECNGEDDDCDGSIDEDTCDDENECTVDSCAGAEGCQYENLNGTNCDDLDVCSVTDHCEEGICVGTKVACDDGNGCTDDYCDGLSGCVFEPNYEPCDDGDPCTIGDICGGGVCAGTQVECQCQADSDCQQFEDQDKCNGTLYCDKSSIEYQCKVDPDTVIECPEPEGIDAPCLDSECVPETGACQFVSAHDSFACDDGDECTYGEKCQEGECTGGQPLNCNDGEQCTVDSCNSETGCAYVDFEGPCNDDDACTVDDFCEAGICAPGPALICDDGNVCTDDSCNPLTGCGHVQNQAACDDGNGCTQNDACENGWCAGTPLNCNDDDVCTDDGCDPETGCVHILNSAWCDDGEPCTEEDVCQNGSCQGGAPPNCDDGNGCTDDSCLPGQGCQNTPNSAPCDDNNLCTDGDACANGQCMPGAAVVCDDGKQCTNDTCAPDTGCAYAPFAPCCGNGILEEPELCDDGNNVSGDGCSATCQFDTPKAIELFPFQVIECGQGYLDNVDHNLGDGYGCVGDDIDVFRTNCSSCEQGGKTQKGVDLEFKPNLPPNATLTSASLVIRAVPDDGFKVQVNVNDYDTGTALGNCDIGPGSQVYMECTVNLNLDFVPNDVVRLYTNSVVPDPQCAYMIYDFVKLKLDYLP